MIDPLLAKALAMVFALLFAGAAWHKLADREGFMAALRNYQILPTIACRPMGLIIPLVELALAACWLSGLFVPAIAVTSVLLLGIYALAIGVNLVRGRVHIDCGCGFANASTKEQLLSWGLVLRNLVFMGMAGLIILPSNERALTFADYIVAFVAVLTALILFAGMEQLIKNRAAIRTWRDTT